jgi:hypothetical protein
LNQTFTFNGQGKSLTIKMVLKNNSASPVTNIVLTRAVDFDIDSAGPSGWGGFTDWHAADTQDGVFAWSDREDAVAAGKEAHGLVLRHLTQSGGVSHNAAIYDFSCNSAAAPLATPVYGDYADSLVYLIPNLGAGASKTITVQYARH